MPNVPPVCVSVLLEPTQVDVALAFTEVAAVELVLMTTVTKYELLLFTLTHGLEVPSARK